MAFKLNIAPRFPPREPRISVRRATVLLLPDDREVAAMLTNVSRSGFTASSDVPIDPKTVLGVEVPGCGIFRAEVRWSDGHELGARFDGQLSEAQVARF